MRLVYIAGPYSSDPLACVQAAMHAGHRVLDAGLYPYVPHLSHFMHEQRERHYEEWMELDLEWLRECHVVWRLPGHSPGADREEAFARERGIPVAHSFEELVRLVVRDLRAQVDGLTEAREPEPAAPASAPVPVAQGWTLDAPGDDAAVVEVVSTL